MNDRANLEDRLAKLASVGLGEAKGRTLRASTVDGLLGAVLAELDTVVMPRELRLTPAKGAAFPVEAANRRIMSYGTGKALVDLRASDPGDAAVGKAFQKVLVKFLGSNLSLRIAYHPLERDFDPTETGIAVKALAEAWKVPLTGSGDSSEFIDTFMALTGEDDSVLGWMIQQGDVVESAGGDDITDGLRELSETDRVSEVLKAAGAPDEPWTFTALTDDPKGSATMVVASHGQTQILIAVAPGTLSAVSDHWRQALTS